MKNIRQLRWGFQALLWASALISHGARAIVPDSSGDADRQRSQTGAIQIKLDNDRIYFSQDAGLTFQELVTMRTPEAAHLKRLLQNEERSGFDQILTVKPTVVADGAGGSQWARPKGTSTGIAPAVDDVPGTADKHAVKGAKESDQSKRE